MDNLPHLDFWAHHILFSPTTIFSPATRPVLQHGRAKNSVQDEQSQGRWFTYTVFFFSNSL